MNINIFTVTLLLFSSKNKNIYFLRSAGKIKIYNARINRSARPIDRLLSDVNNMITHSQHLDLLYHHHDLDHCYRY